MTSVRIVMLIQNFYPAIGGAERQAFQLSRALSKKGHHITVLTRKIKSAASEESLSGFKVRRLFSAGNSFLSPFFFMLTSFFYLLKNRNEYQVIHVHLASSHALPAALIGRAFKKKVIVKFGGGKGIGEVYSSVHTLSGRLKLWFLRAMKPILVIVSQEQLEELKKSGLGKLTIHEIPNGIDTELFQPATPEKRKELRKTYSWSGVVFLFVGRFAPDKLRLDIFENLIEAWKQALGKFQNGSLIFIGKGPLEEKYKKVVANKDLSGSVLFLGPKDDVGTYYQAADVFVLPSIAEGLSNALLEAMATGVPVVGSRVSGVDNMIQEGVHGFLFDPFKPEEMAKAFIQMAESSEKRQALSQAAKEKAKQYSIEEVSHRYSQIYSESSKIL